ncbi:Lsr2 family protein [Nonomuraea sp. NPDC026600]|uniref:histone-like nucleoid-structuring protein Lsr2 n=1 Tax=Nonomuraea sp. NPDC026600 TaxID=3155363 RepID=UPI0033DB68EC
MAKQIVESFIDDIDGSEAEKTTTFAIDGTSYEIDLSGRNREDLEKALAPYITVARPIRAERPGRGGHGADSTSRAMNREKSSEIRNWAKVHGLPVSERGRIASTIVEKYKAAQ